jgi:hypothetical protein
MAEPSIRDRIAAIVGDKATRQIVEILDEEAVTRCQDADCMRRLPHARLARHLWRHVPVAPLSPGLLGRRCFTCGRPSWRRIHNSGRPS